MSLFDISPVRVLLLSTCVQSVTVSFTTFKGSPFVERTEFAYSLFTGVHVILPFIGSYSE